MTHRIASLTLAAALAASPAPSEAIAPAVLFMVKQVAQQAATSMIKDALLSQLSGMGCKGIALSNALAAFDVRRAAGGAVALGGGMPSMPRGVGLPTMPSVPGSGLSLGGMPGGGAIPPEIAARMGELMPGLGRMPADMAVDPEVMSSLQQMLSQPPLSPPETLATIDELFDLGFMPKSVQAEFKECMLLLPDTLPMMGMAMGMLKPIVPQLRQAREQLHALSPAEQDEAAAALGQELKALPADQRSALIEHLDSGFFPARVAAGAKAAVGR